MNDFLITELAREHNAPAGRASNGHQQHASVPLVPSSGLARSERGANPASGRGRAR